MNEPSTRPCSHHPDAPAIAVCHDCRADICGACHGTDTRGLAICRPCRRAHSPSPVPWEDPADGPSLRGFGSTLWAALTNPRTFFRHFRTTDSWGWAAAFGILCIILGTLVNTFWQQLFSARWAETTRAWQTELGIAPDLVPWLIYASIPFGALLLYFIHTGLMYLALRALDVDGADWSVVSRITGYSLAAYALLIVPPVGDFSLGHFLMVLWLFNLEVGAVRALFGLGFWRSIGVVLVPFVVFLFVIG